MIAKPHDVSEAVTEVFHRADYYLNAQHRGPVALDRLFQAMNVVHVALPQLRPASIADYLLRERYVFRPELVADMLGDEEPLIGLLFWVGDDGLAFVSADDILARRRFTAAHELGHAVLHRGRMPQYIADASIHETGDATEPMEREADRFAAELLMPEEVLRVRADEMRRRFGVCPRQVLAYRLASELLVSREAMRYRLKALEVGDE